MSELDRRRFLVAVAATVAVTGVSWCSAGGPNEPVARGDVPGHVEARRAQAEAIRRAAMWEEFNLFWFEEPLPAEDISGHAALKAHTAFVPLDASFPADRVAYIASDAGVRLILTRSDIAARLYSAMRLGLLTCPWYLVIFEKIGSCSVS